MPDIIDSFGAYLRRKSVPIICSNEISFLLDPAEVRGAVITLSVGGSVLALWDPERAIGKMRREPDGQAERLTLSIEPWLSGAICSTFGREAELLFQSTVSPFPLAAVPVRAFLPKEFTDSYLAELNGRLDRTHWGVDALFVSEGYYYVLGWAIPPVGAGLDDLRVRLDGKLAAVTPHLAPQSACTTYWFVPEILHAGFLAIGSCDFLGEYARISIEFGDDECDVKQNSRYEIYNYVRDFSDLQHMLPPLGNIHRVSGPIGNEVSYLNGGYTDYHRFRALMSQAGIDPDRPGLRILDWGCGCGRVARHFIEQDSCPQVTGVDIDDENIAWCAEYLRPGRFQSVGLYPPTGLEGEAYDVVISSSVLSHLTSHAMEAWLQEIDRLLAPQGVALLSYNGDSTSFLYTSSQPAIIAALQVDGFFDGIRSSDLDGHIADPEYYRLTFMTDNYAKAVFERTFTVAGIARSVVSGHQNVAILRKAPYSDINLTSLPPGYARQHMLAALFRSANPTS